MGTQPERDRRMTNQISHRRNEMHPLLEDLARAHCRERLAEAEQYRRVRLATKLVRAQRQAAKARLRADRSAAKVRLAVARLA
jgi:hypothetical protein